MLEIIENNEHICIAQSSLQGIEQGHLLPRILQVDCLGQCFWNQLCLSYGGKVDEEDPIREVFLVQQT